MSERGRGSLAVAAAFAFLIVLPAAGARADDDRGEAHAGLRVYAQPAASDFLLVLTPSVSARAAVTRWLRFDANWSADVVTGATPRSYGRADVISAATPFTELRNSAGAGAEVTLGPAKISAGYQYGTENDYHSQLVRAGLELDLAQHNTILTAGYGHAFDSVCDLDQSALAVTLRQPLSSSLGCFTSTAGLTAQPLAIDNAELSLAQTLTPRLVATLIGTYQHLSGFQSNPYRRVRLDEGLLQAQESHPRLRDRGALTARVRYAIAKLRASLGADVRLYRDTWGVQSLTGELNWEQPFSRRSHWRFGARTRGYVQSGANFYRDAGAANSYERAGPVGQYFTADQELAPLADLLVGADFVYSASRSQSRRIWRLFEDSETTLLVNYVKAFALSPDPPNVARIDSWANALVLGVSTTGRF